MPIAVTCTCGKAFHLKDDLAGQTLTCPRCGNAVQVPAAPAVQAQADAAFDRDTFLINQRIAIDARYQVTDEAGRPVVYVVRPTYLLRNLGALLAGVAVGMTWLFVMISLADAAGQQSAPGALLGLLGGLGWIPIALVIGIALSKKRHTTIYRDEGGRERLLEVEQDRKWQWITWTYTVKGPAGETLARLKKNVLTNLIRKRWRMETPDGRLLVTAKEESIILSLLRRFLGPLFGLLRTNFVILQGDSDAVVGEFNRRMTILDRYVLDMKRDARRTVDRRLALALGVMLDTGERR